MPACTESIRETGKKGNRSLFIQRSIHNMDKHAFVTFVV